MNRDDKTHYSTLSTCPVCGMDSGMRKVTVKVPERFFIVCDSCGFKTRPHKTQGAATQEWNRRNADG